MHGKYTCRGAGANLHAGANLCGKNKDYQIITRDFHNALKLVEGKLMAMNLHLVTKSHGSDGK